MLFRHLDIAIARLWPTRLDADGHQGLSMLREEIESQFDHPLELRLVGHQMVRGGHHDVGVLTLALDAVAGVGDAGRGVTASRLTQHLVRLQHGELFENQGFVGGVGHHQEIAIGNEGMEALVGALDEALPRAEDVDELLRVIIFA